jgi:hypothetical protein
MKKILVYAAALLSMAFAASCQKEVSPELGRGEAVNVTFTISNEAIQSKAVVGEEPEWEKELTFGVYRNGQLLSPAVYSITDDFGTDNEATVTVTLVKGQTYDFVFWADSKGTNYYTVDLENKNVTVNYGGLAANNKYRDAWYATLEGYKVTDSNLNQNITLRRAVAQINVGTLDYDKAVTAGVTVTKSEVTVKGVANVLDLFTGKTEGNVDVTFAAAALPMNTLPAGENTLSVFRGADQATEYEYLSLNYVLVADNSADGTEKGLVTFVVDFYEDGNDQPVNNPIEINNVPVRRNYRTNIISENVLTDMSTFSIVIDPAFDGEFDPEGNDWKEYPYNGTTPPTPTPVDNNLYLNPGPWNVDGAWFAAYFFGNAGNTSVKMIKDGNYYKCEKVAGDYANVIFVRMNPSYTTFTWDGKWNQTDDLVIPTDGKNLYTVTGWGTADGTWSVK